MAMVGTFRSGPDSRGRMMSTVMMSGSPWSEVLTSDVTWTTSRTASSYENTGWVTPSATTMPGAS